MKTNGLSCIHSRSTAKAFKASAAELADAHSCHQRWYCHRLVVPLGWATAPLLDTGGRGWAVACLTTLYDITIQFFITIRALNYIFPNILNIKFNCIRNSFIGFLNYCMSACTKWVIFYYSYSHRKFNIDK